MAAAGVPGAGPPHSRDLSFHVTYTIEEIPKLAKEILDGTIAEVHLSLFTYWLCEKTEHYAEARKHIRELGLDQSYATNRIENSRLRKLVEDVKHLRPSYEYGDSDSDDEEEDDQSDQKLDAKAQLPKRHTSLRFPFSPLSKISGVNALLRSHSSEYTVRSPPETDEKVLEMLHSRSRQASSPMRPRSPWAARSESLPANMKKQTSSSVASLAVSEHEYPPDTPDRPAPLSLRSPRPDSAPSALLRTVSTPLRSERVPRFALSPGAMRGLLDANSNTSSTKGKATPATNHATTGAEGDVFGSIGVATSPQDRRLGMAPCKLDTFHTNAHAESGRGETRFELQPHELAESESNSPMTQSPCSSTGFGFSEEHNTQVQESSASYDEVDTEWQSTSTSSDHRSSIEGQIGPSIQHNRAGNQNSNRSPHSRPRAPKPALTLAQRRAAAQTRRRVRPPILPMMTGFHRPLPLRSYESEAFLYPTARAQGHNRASSLNISPSQGRHPLLVKVLEEKTPIAERSNSNIQRTSIQGVTVSTSELPRDESMDSVLSQFPIVPDSNAPLSPDSLRNAYRTVTEAYMTQALSRTRERGAQLPVIQWSAATPFETAWRNMNERLLISVYGRKDVALADEDVHFIERIAKELDQGVGRISGYEWVNGLFQGD